MEFLGFIGIILIYFFFNLFLNAGVKTVKAVGKAAVGKGSIAGNLENEVKGMGELRLRVSDKSMGDNSDEGRFKSIEGKGLFPISSKTRIGVVTSVFVKVDGELTPVLSAIDEFQEPESTVFQWSQELGDCEPGWGYSDWVRFAPIVPEYLIPPYGGNCTLNVFIRIIDLNNPPSIRHGYHGSNKSGLLWQKSLVLEHNFEGKGYLEASEDANQARAFAVKLGVSVAMADGTLDDEEGVVLKNWIKKTIEPYEGDRREELKNLYNNALRESYELAKSGELSLSETTANLSEIAENAQKYEAIELCFEVMAADGVADPEELKTIHAIAGALDLNYEEIERLRYQKLVGLERPISQDSSVEEVLGIDSSWPVDRIKKQLRLEFQKWNGRLNSLDAGPDRDKAQDMLVAIADARKKYD